MADPAQLPLLQQGVKVWNEWKAGQEAAVDLKGGDLRGKDLSGADLRGADLRGANLLSANLSGADLYQADLNGADLQEVNFTAASLIETNLREANLQGADLSGVIGGIRTEQLAGANLTGAKLPEQLKKLYDGLENVKGISESARKLFLAVLAACLYCWLTIATTTDVNLITNRNSSPLPIIQTSIPIVGFYVLAPLLVLCVYFYFHFYLQKLWEELGSLPAASPDGRPLHAKVDPWLLNDLVRSHLPKLSVNRPFLSYLQLWISVLLAWWVVPITMLLFWGRYLRRHELIGTAFHVVLLVISLVAAVCLYQLAVATLCGVERRPFAWKTLLTSHRSYGTAAFACAAFVLFGLVSFGALSGIRSNRPILGHIPKSEEMYNDNLSEPIFFYGPRTWVPRWMALAGYPPFANMTNAEVSQKGATSSGAKDQDQDLEQVTGGQLSRAYLRYASASHAFLAGADLSAADVRGADLRNADLRRADLQGADLSEVYLDDAILRGADLTDAKLFRTEFMFADLRDVRLLAADMVDADLFQADLRGADLRRVRLAGANLKIANLSGADLEEARLGGADLSFTNLTSAKNLDPEQVKRADHWDKACYDDATLKALGLPPDHNQKVAQEYAKEFPWSRNMPCLNSSAPKQ